LYLEFQTDYDAIEPPVVTKSFRQLANSYYKKLKEYPLEDVFDFCEKLLSENRRGYTIVAYQLADKRHNEYTIDTFQRFDHWMNTYLQDWWDCDDFMTHAMGKLYLKFPHLWEHILAWTTSSNFAVRRSAAVVLIPAAKTKQLDIKRAFQVSDILMNDEHYLVQKGFGWLLKEATKHYKEDVVTYLEEHVTTLSRTAFRYAIEKLDMSEKERLMSL
jgi:3-methyladenine DNA glycosylase AlkD